jgi:hypothetical protein
MGSRSPRGYRDDDDDDGFPTDASHPFNKQR